jgi:hypothetical protein
MQQPNDGETLSAILAAALAAGFDVTADQLRRWHRTGLLPRPEQVGLGRPRIGERRGEQERGSTVVYPVGTTAQLLALCALRGKHKKLDRLGWPLWWRGYDVAERHVRKPLARVVDNLAAIRDAFDGLDISAFDMRQGLSARDLERRTKALSRFKTLAARILKPRDERRLQKHLGISNARRFLELWLLFLSGRLQARDLDSVELPVTFFPAETQPTQADARETVAQLSGAIHPDVLRAGLNRARDLTDLSAARDELRAIATTLAPVMRPIFDKAFPLAAQKLSAYTLDDMSEGTQHIALLGFLAHRAAIAIAIRTLGEIPSWVTETGPESE